jgi:hypothetical protein
MWHLKTRLGVFWVAPVFDSPNQYYLGINDEELGKYPNAEEAAQDVHNQVTGFMKWDTESKSKIKAPEHIEGWIAGEPKAWQTN